MIMQRRILIATSFVLLISMGVIFALQHHKAVVAQAHTPASSNTASLSSLHVQNPSISTIDTSAVSSPSVSAASSINGQQAVSPQTQTGAAAASAGAASATASETSPPPTPALTSTPSYKTTCPYEQSNMTVCSPCPPACRGHLCPLSAGAPAAGIMCVPICGYTPVNADIACPE